MNNKELLIQLKILTRIEQSKIARELASLDQLIKRNQVIKQPATKDMQAVSQEEAISE